MNEAVSPALEGVTISASAARRLNAILKGEAGAALRISVKGGGCSGFQYAFDVERSRAEDDVAVTRDGATCWSIRSRSKCSKAPSSISSTT